MRIDWIFWLDNIYYGLEVWYKQLNRLQTIMIFFRKMFVSFKLIANLSLDQAIAETAAPTIKRFAPNIIGNLRHRDRVDSKVCEIMSNTPPSG